ncbi:MAG TPA: diguanylate cyclase [Candidatus Saccharimonadales bacterium]|nr:diguanylate cyclase [Candidatus Saccharimonadales bacterium]
MIDQLGEDYLQHPELLDELDPPALRRLVGRLSLVAAWQRTRIEQLERSVNRLSTDELLESLMSPQGGNERIILNAALQEELRIGQFAIISIDVRGVKALNEQSFAHGNELLMLFAERGLATSIRMDDIICRRGDDFFALARNVDQDAAAQIAGRLEADYSVERGLQDIENGLVPVMASVSFVHALEIPGECQVVDDLLHWKDGLENEASRRNIAPKKSQYAHMWELLGGDTNAKPSDERFISKLFFERFCPDYVGKIEASMAQRRLVVRQ